MRTLLFVVATLVPGLTGINLTQNAKIPMEIPMQDLNIVGPAGIQQKASLSIRPAQDQSFAQKVSSSWSSSSSDNTKRPFAEFITGLILICLALPAVWMNERNCVKIYEVIKQAQVAIQGNTNIDNTQVDPKKDFDLVHTTGRNSTEKPSVDERFSISIDDCVKIKRVIEMYQWVETIVKKEDEQDKVTYTKEWKTYIQSSNNFRQKGGHTNPSKMPCETEQFKSEVNLGNYTLPDSQIDMLNDFKEFTPSEDQQATISKTTSEFFNQQGYNPITYQGNVFITKPLKTMGVKTMGADDEIALVETGTAIGDVKITWRYVPCGEITVIAQQMINDKDELTFRQWNPKKTQVKWGENNDSSTEASCPESCICCFIVEKGFKTFSQEVLNYCGSGNKTSEEVFAQLIEDNQGNTTKIRWTCWLVSVIGHVLLFSPIIALLTWIPLVGHLLGAIFMFAAVVFALLWASILHFLIMGISWLVYRPLYGIMMLSLVGLGIAIMALG